MHLQHAGSGQYVNLHSWSSYLAAYGSTAFSSGLAYGSQTVSGGSISANLLSGSAEYFLFGGDGYCYCVTQYTSTIYNMLLFGTMTKTCDSRVVPFCPMATGAVRVRRHRQRPMPGKPPTAPANTSSRMFYSSLTRQLDSYSPITFNGVTPLYPITVEVGRTTPTYYYSMVGYIPEVRLLRMNGQYANKDIVTLGSDEWMVFSTSYGGYAFKK
ncbi:MAG: hypothetical protein IPG35_18280 [Flavobacteriales bacterium]|nr:hypothetical protein [Flavobacteriales bacterium]